eukprot:TRINITY_DN45130_c0_g1_i1.p1 TRINITY_DN45130_c0_g1~~TRINITY_DN45130_c0_g1_i1.p1  ORF type:complete len:154 (-),score=10.97 TRINITY_DN45130_c0_g1_i1:29-490(-)
MIQLMIAMPELDARSRSVTPCLLPRLRASLLSEPFDLLAKDLPFITRDGGKVMQFDFNFLRKEAENQMGISFEDVDASSLMQLQSLSLKLPCPDCSRDNAWTIVPVLEDSYCHSCHRNLRSDSEDLLDSEDLFLKCSSCYKHLCQTCAKNRVR